MENPTQEFKPTPPPQEPICLLDDYLNIPFNPELFPKRIREICDHLHELRGTPLEMLYFCAAGVIAGVAGDRFKAVNCCKDYEQCLNQFFLGIGESSAGKSTALEPLTNAIIRKEAKAYSLYQQAVKSKVDASDPHFIINNATSEALGVRMSISKQPLFSLSAEARDVLSIIGGEYKKGGGASELSFYCRAWSGESYSVERVNRDSIFIERAFLSALWLVQPDVFSTLNESKTNTSSGFIARLFLFKANAPLQYDTDETPPRNEQIFYNWESFLLGLLNNRNGNIKLIKATSAARAIFLAYENKYVDIQNAIKDYAGYVSKSREKACRLALLFAICDDKNEIDEQTARNACEIVDYSNGVLLDLVSVGYKARAEQTRTKIEAFFIERKTSRLTARDFRNYKRIELPELERAAQEYPQLFRIEDGKNKGKAIYYTPQAM